MNVASVPLEKLAEAWPVIEPLARRVARRWPDDWPVAEIARQAAAGDILLWLAGDVAPLALLATQCIEKPTGKRVLIVKWAAGENRRAWLRAVRDRLLHHAAQFRCAELTVPDARLGWERDLPECRTQRSTTLTPDVPHA